MILLQRQSQVSRSPTCSLIRMNHDMFHEGQKVWVELEGGKQRPAVYVGGGENSVFFGGPPLAYIVLTDTREGAEVELSQIIPRDK